MATEGEQDGGTDVGRGAFASMTLIGLLLLVQIVQTLSSPLLATDRFLEAQALSISGWDNRPQTLVTHALVHLHWPHCLANLAGLALFAVPVERALGPPRLAALWLVGVLAAALAHLLLFGDSSGRMIGASGGCMAILGFLSGVRLMLRAEWGARPLRGTRQLATSAIAPVLWLCLALRIDGAVAEHASAFLAGVPELWAPKKERGYARSVASTSKPSATACSRIRSRASSARSTTLLRCGCFRPWNATLAVPANWGERGLLGDSRR